MSSENNQKPLKVLHVVTVMDCGGVETRLMELMRHKSYATTERFYLDAEALMGQEIGKIQVAPVIREAVG